MCLSIKLIKGNSNSSVPAENDKWAKNTTDSLSGTFGQIAVKERKNWLFNWSLSSHKSWIIRDLKAKNMDHISNMIAAQDPDTFLIALIGEPLHQSTCYSSAIMNSFDGMTLHK